MAIFGASLGAIARRNAVAGTLWSPTQLSTALRAWYDPSDAATVIISGGLITQLNDKSASAANLSPRSTREPVLQANAQNGLAMINFAGNKDLWGALTFSGTNRFGVHLVVRTPVTANWQNDGRIVSLAASGQNDWNSAGRTAITRNGTGASVATPRNNTSTMNTAIAIDAFNILSYWSDGATQRLTVNSTTVTSTSSATSNLTVGTFSLAAQQLTTNNFFNGWIGEVLLENLGTLANSETCQGYLAHRWGLQTLLNAAHPFRNTPP